MFNTSYLRPGPRDAHIQSVIDVSLSKGPEERPNYLGSCAWHDRKTAGEYGTVAVVSLALSAALFTSAAAANLLDRPKTEKVLNSLGGGLLVLGGLTGFDAYNHSVAASAFNDETSSLTPTTR